MNLNISYAPNVRGGIHCSQVPRDGEDAGPGTTPGEPLTVSTSIQSLGSQPWLDIEITRRALK